MAGTLKAMSLSDGASSITTSNIVSGSYRAFVVMDSFATPITIKSSFNMSSVTDNAAGFYTLNFLNPMPNPHYYVMGGALSNDSNNGGTLNLRLRGDFRYGPTLKTINAVEVLHWAGSGIFDCKDMYAVIGGC